ncbi:hypothetical protein Dsin_012003 [Dipteronia sinensis]|uniref:Cytochrome P450 n=1 Tax=Dipteronia sinensis TaxID=43782 RepID=A0AAE0E7I4_9ROSI|nr:hypothetical protein Dsin_012003 [Dipteronia sinensis]
MALLLVLASIIFIFLAYKLHQRLRFKLPPGPRRPWPIVGNLLHIKPVKFLCFAELAQAYGPIISVWFGSSLDIIVSNTDLAKQVLKEHDQKLADRYRTRASARFSRDGQDLIWADYGPHYVNVRKVCTLELFSSKRLEALRPIREDEVTAMVESIFNDCTALQNNGKSVLVRKHLGAVAFNNITRLAFGKRFVNSEGVMDKQGEELKAIVSNGIKIGGSLNMAEHIPWLRWMFPLNEEASTKQADRRDRLSRAIMEEHTLARQNSGGAKQHFVDALLHCKTSMTSVKTLLLDFFGYDMITAGTDTTAITVEWAMAELIKNPRVQQKAQEELDRVIGFERVLTESDFSNLPYLQSVAKEGLRLHPPTPLMLPHRANANVKIGGYDIPKGSNVHVNVWAIARDPAVWKDPLEFRPERFFEEDVDMKGHDYRLLPFGAGRRVCPGAQLGINLVTSMIGHLLHHFTWTPAEGVKPEDMDMSENPGLVTYMRTPLQAVAIPRLPSQLFENSEGVMDVQGLEFNALLANGVKISASLTMAEFIPWLRWMFPLEEKVFAKHGAQRDRLTRAIMEEHTLARQQSDSAKQHFVDAMLTLQDKYDLSEDTIIGLLWDMITAAMDTIAITVEWAMAELIKNPRKDPLEFRPERFFEEDVDMKDDFRLLPFGAGHLLHHFIWTPPEGVKPEDIDLSENLGLVTYLRTPLQAVPIPRLSSQLYKRVVVDV